ncbi:uroporphyrinogen-III synthase, partial [Halomonas sp. BM-2019]|uniref:uroporphyrinogen-III synthase n=1 Tax=Halomonas sp. BM-2019 TaxID=2811227 RepID=UPI001B3C4BB8
MAAAPVVITRPGERGDVLAALPESSAPRAAWLDFDHFRRVVVVSPFAAECLAEALDRYWPQLPVGIDYYAVGAATAEALHARLGVRVHVPPASAGEDTSEALLRLGSLRELTGEQVLLV